MDATNRQRTPRHALVDAIGSDGLLAELATIYEDLHEHPELSMHEVRTAERAADELAAHGYEVTRGVGGISASARSRPPACRIRATSSWR